SQEVADQDSPSINPDFLALYCQCCRQTTAGLVGLYLVPLNILEKYLGFFSRVIFLTCDTSTKLHRSVCSVCAICKGCTTSIVCKTGWVSMLWEEAHIVLSNWIMPQATIFFSVNWSVEWSVNPDCTGDCERVYIIAPEDVICIVLVILYRSFPTYLCTSSH
ncbi:unnamed protein product, partial [Choristocarpus tenellus]